MRTWLASLGVLLLGALILHWATDGNRAFTAETARRLAVAQQPRPVPDLALQTHTGADTRLRDLQGRLVVATFIYTRCRSMCPMLGVRMQQIRRALPAEAVGQRVHFLSLSFDPGYDTPQRLRAYAQAYGASADHWWVARPRSGLQPVLDRLGVVVIPHEGGYRHNAAFYLIDRRGRLVAILDEQAPERVAQAVRARL